MFSNRLNFMRLKGTYFNQPIRSPDGQNYSFILSSKLVFTSFLWVRIHARKYLRTTSETAVLAMLSEDQQHTALKKRVRINVRGARYETYEQTLARYPYTLLGSQAKRSRYYDPKSGEYNLDRDTVVFDAILFYYQSPGILAKPDHVPLDLFTSEVKFFEIEKDRIDPAFVPDEVKREEIPPRNLKEKIWQFLEDPQGSWGHWLANLSGLIIVLSLAAYCLETVPNMMMFSFGSEIQTNSSKNNISNQMREGEEEKGFWFTLEAFFTVWFTVEFLIRFLTAPSKLKFLRSCMAIIDLMAIVPFYITLYLNKNLEDVTSFIVLRVIRLVRILKLKRYSTSIKLLTDTIYESQDQLSSFYLCLVMNVILFSTAIYYAEGKGRNSTPFKSIPDAFWWALVTISSVGYGDQVPRTVGGKVVGSLCCFAGVLTVFCFSPVLFANFKKCWQRHFKEQAEIRTCTVKEGLAVFKHSTKRRF